MAALDFPHLGLTIGQTYPSPPVSGQPVYTWDGEKWGSGNVDYVGAVRYDTAQSLTAAQQVQARQNVYAAPFDALAYSGMQVNGSMEVSQELGTAGSGGTNATSYIVDGWVVSSVGTQTISATPPASGSNGFTKDLRAAVPVANAAPAAGHYAIVGQRIEGYRVSRLAWGAAGAQPITIAFWVSAVRPGNYSGSVQNVNSDRSYPFSFTVNAASTYEYKTVTIPGDTTGTWAKDNTVGIRIFFTLMAGSSFQATAGVWAAGNYFGATGTINGVAATSDTFFITGVIVLPGIEAPSAARSPLIMRPFDQELLTCKRYFQTFGGVTPIEFIGSGVVYSTSSAEVVVPFQTQMRAQPTISFIGSMALVLNTTGLVAATGLSASSISFHSCAVIVTGASGLVVGNQTMLATNADINARFRMDARL